MKPKKLLAFGFVVLAIALLLAPWPVGLTAQQNNSAPVRIDSDDIGGVVTSANGPEAGVWGIAETTDLDRKSTRLNSSHGYISYAVFCLKKKKLSPTASPEASTPYSDNPSWTTARLRMQTTATPVGP